MNNWFREPRQNGKRRYRSGSAERMVRYAVMLTPLVEAAAHVIRALD